MTEFENRIIPFDTDCAQLWGTLLSGEKRDPHTIDKQIAAIAIMHDMTLLTGDRGGGYQGISARNLKIVDPFQDRG
ncbi:hypothetical protein LJR289_001065 [Pseudoduganella sp. LjRoot289]|uniref:hypothetical protein n=1 Tax=Pseudoduganella sp. LjRoot289 TaxID=3342314 RepID=UPI003ECE567C